MWGNRNSTFAGRILLLIGVIMFPSKWDTLKHEHLRGRSAKRLKHISVTDMMNCNLNRLRHELCIEQ